MDLSFPTCREKVEQYIIYIVPIIATCIFLNQIYRQSTLDLSVWKGGGMGMFAALDRPRSTRFVKVHITDADGNRLPFSGYDELSYRVKVEPSEKNLNRLLSKLVNTQWRYSDRMTPIYTRDLNGNHSLKRYEFLPIPYGNNSGIIIKSIEIQYGQIYYDTDNEVLYSKIIKERQYDY